MTKKMECTNTIHDLSVLDVSLVCRGCLTSNGEMKNMMEWGLAEDFHKLTNVQIDMADGISQLICSSCEDVLHQFTRFSSQCKQSDALLKSTKEKNISQEGDNEIINTVNFDLQNYKLIIMVVAPNMAAKIHLPCPFCSKNNFLKKSDLLNHIHKDHNHKTFSIDIKYHCHKPNCPYHVNSAQQKSFTGRKFLNQHINKVHNNKGIVCKTCTLKFATESDFNRHLKTCNYLYICQICNTQYQTNEKLLVHLLRRHPDLHKEYKERKAEKRKATEKVEEKEKLDYCDSPKRSSATQTFGQNIKNDVTFWHETKKDEISTQTVFEDLLALKSQTSEDDSIFFSETVSLSDIQTQTIPLEFGLCRSNKETITSETQSPDFSIKETQTCFCHFGSPKPRFENASPFSLLTSTETQTLDSNLDHDVLLSCAETQTCFENDLDKNI